MVTLTPLAQLAVFYLVFNVVLPLNVSNYLSFLFSGVLVWNWFQISLYQATSTIVDNRELIKRPGFPVAILPIVTVTSHLIHFFLALPILFWLPVGGWNPFDPSFARVTARDCASIYLNPEPGLFCRHFLCHLPGHPAPPQRALKSAVFSYTDIL